MGPLGPVVARKVAHAHNQPEETRQRLHNRQALAASSELPRDLRGESVLFWCSVGRKQYLAMSSHELGLTLKTVLQKTVFRRTVFKGEGKATREGQRVLDADCLQTVSGGS